jgi:hypothetical protein
MKKNNKHEKLKIQTLLITTIGLGLLSLTLFMTLFFKIIRARIINFDDLSKEFESQREAQLYNPAFIPKISIQRGVDYDKGFDLKCFWWSQQAAGSGWSKNSKDSDFFIEYYVPPDKRAIICATPVFATALTTDPDKPFVYEVSPTNYGFRVRIIIGASEVRQLCQKLTGQLNCANSLLVQQAAVKYEP